MKASLATVLNNCDSFWGQIRPDDTDSIIKWPDKQQAFSSLTQPWSLKPDDSLFMSARGVYLDYMNSETLIALKQQLSKNNNIISQIPFYDIALNDVAPYCEANQSGWCSNITNTIEVGSGLPTNPNGLSPGMLFAKHPTDSDVTISFDLKRSNSGLIPFTLNSFSSNSNPADDPLDKAQFKLQVLEP